MTRPKRSNEVVRFRKHHMKTYAVLMRYAALEDGQNIVVADAESDDFLGI
jgi:hypothetical protein